MQFVVPKFIERETKLVGPLTFKQFLYVLGTFAVLIALNFLIPPRGLFFAIAFVVGGLGLSLAFVKVGPYSFPDFLKNLLKFSTYTQLYIWKKKMIIPQTTRGQKPQKEETEQTSELRVIKKSRLGDLSTKIEVTK